MDGESNALEASTLVQSTLSQAGFVANVKKSIWKPTQRLQWLGFVIDLSQGLIEVPRDRLTAVACKLQRVCQLELVPAKQLASVVGSITSMGLAIGSVSRFMTRSLYTLLNTGLSWWEMLEVTPEARQELEFWKACLDDYNCQPIWHSPSAVRVVYSDASDTGLASISRLSPSKRTNCSVTFDPPVRKGGRGPGRSHHVMLAARDVASCSAC